MYEVTNIFPLLDLKVWSVSFDIIAKGNHDKGLEVCTLTCCYSCGLALFYRHSSEDEKITFIFEGTVLPLLCMLQVVV